jgi:hypothetical protein
LISGCGITYETAAYKTWPRVLKSLGYNIFDTSGPAVSNQWILNKALLKLLVMRDIDTVILQLTDIGKLDIEVSQDRLHALVINDTLRNFVITPDHDVVKIDDNNADKIDPGSIWPSSFSLDHPAKRSWKQYLYSASLEMEDIFCKLILFQEYCQKNHIRFLVFQGYALPWQSNQSDRLESIVKNAGTSFYGEYLQSEFYQLHDHSAKNTVPCFPYQIRIAQKIAQYIDMDLDTREKLNHIVNKYNNGR